MPSADTSSASGSALCPSPAGPNGPAEACSGNLGWGLTTMVRAFGQQASASLADLPGGPRGHLVLVTIAHGHPPSQLALAHALGVDRTVMTYLLDELEGAGLVERRPDPADRRARQILLTAKGDAALSDYSARLAEAEDRLLAPLDPQEAQVLRSMIERVARAAQAAPGTGCTVSDGSPCPGGA